MVIQRPTETFENAQHDHSAAGAQGGTITNITGNAATATAAAGLLSATTTVAVSAATAPNNGDVLTASSGTAAAWVAPSAGTVASKAEVITGTDNTKFVSPAAMHEITIGPQGYLMNGKIVPSVSSNNLTVAIKGLDGNNPSATNPVYVRIGDTVRSITAALSVTKNAGTNWCNAGGAQLATQEIDYFVYLGFNATDLVVIGFSRIPYATQYADFSSTSTNDKYAGISTITNAAAADNYENVGRFAATLSAGAGYTWTVPTFTSANLIQRPIFETRGLSVNSPANITVSNGSFTSLYVIKGRTMSVNEIFTMGGSSSFGNAAFYLPFPPPNNRMGIGNFSILDSGVLNATYMMGSADNDTTAQVSTIVKSTTSTNEGTGLSATVPITWAVNDICALNYYGIY